MLPIRILAIAAATLALAGCASQYAGLYPKPMKNPRGEAPDPRHGDPRYGDPRYGDPRDGYAPPPVVCHRGWFGKRCAAT